MKIYLVISLLLIVFSCDINELPVPTPSKEKELEVDNFLFIDSLRFENDSVTIPEFAIDLQLSEKTKEKLLIDKEFIIDRAIFSGIPKDTVNEEFEKWGKVFICDNNVELWNSNIANFKAIKMARQNFNELIDSNYEVLINVFSGRRSVLTNLLDSDIIQENINFLKGKSHELEVKLLTE
jgi:hypothetical protein